MPETAMFRLCSLGTSLKAAKALVAFGLVFAAGAAWAAKAKDKKEDPKPTLEILFNDDSTTLDIQAEWVEEGKGRRENFSYGKDIYLSFTQQKNGEWAKDNTFRSKTYEAYLY